MVKELWMRYIHLTMYAHILYFRTNHRMCMDMLLNVYPAHHSTCNIHNKRGDKLYTTHMQTEDVPVYARGIQNKTYILCVHTYGVVGTIKICIIYMWKQNIIQCVCVERQHNFPL